MGGKAKTTSTDTRNAATVPDRSVVEMTEVSLANPDNRRNPFHSAEPST